MTRQLLMHCPMKSEESPRIRDPVTIMSMVGQIVVRHTNMGGPDEGQDRVLEKLDSQHSVEEAARATLEREVVLRRIAPEERSRYAEVARHLSIAEVPIAERNVHHPPIRLTKTEGLEVVPAVHDSTCRPEAGLIGKVAGPVVLEASPVGVAASMDEVFAVANGARLRRLHLIMKGQELTGHRDFLRGTDVRLSLIHI